MSTKILLFVGLMTSALILSVVQLTTPATIHPAGLLGFFVLLYVVFLVIFTIVLRSVAAVLSGLQAKRGRPLRISKHLGSHSAYMYATMLAFAPVILIAMRSVGAYGFTEVFLVVVLEVVMCFYVWKRQ